MKRFTVFVGCVVAIWLLFWLHERNPGIRANPGEESALPGASPNSVEKHFPRPDQEEEPSQHFSTIQNRISHMKSSLEGSADEWRTPIRFYGKVLDENSNSVPGAQIDFSWTDLSLTGNSQAQASSAHDGSFSLEGVTGKNLIVRVSKEGYYTLQPFGLAFNYAGEQHNFSGDKHNPIIFALKRKAEADALIHFSKSFKVPKNGDPVEIDLCQAKQVAPGSGDLRVQCWTRDDLINDKGRYDWKCRVSINGGGLIVSTNEFEFNAPQDDYVNADEIRMMASLNESWFRFERRRYFAKLRNGNYCRLSLEMIAFNDHFFKLDCYVNPTGSSKLEFDPSKEISPSP
jgi:hypothetical protein